MIHTVGRHRTEVGETVPQQRVGTGQLLDARQQRSQGRLRPLPVLDREHARTDERRRIEGEAGGDAVHVAVSIGRQQARLGPDVAERHPALQRERDSLALDVAAFVEHFQEQRVGAGCQGTHVPVGEDTAPLSQAVGVRRRQHRSP